MRFRSNLSAITVATLLAFGPSAYAKHAIKQIAAPQQTLVQEEATATKSSVLAPAYYVSYDPYNPVPNNNPSTHNQFMTWAEDLNGAKSHEPMFNCWCIFCKAA